MYVLRLSMIVALTLPLRILAPQEKRPYIKRLKNAVFSHENSQKNPLENQNLDWYHDINFLSYQMDADWHDVNRVYAGIKK